jgi:hypothetical protein
MPDDRLFHKRAATSEKVSGLTDFEYRVWTTYLLAADDFGVMRFSALALQSASDALERRKHLGSAFEQLVKVGLVRVFEHQGKRYAYQPDWQDWQSVRYPRASVLPIPSPEELATCSKAQQKLFALKSRAGVEDSPQDSGKVSEKFRTPTGAGGREEANGSRLTAHASVSGSSLEESRETFSPINSPSGRMRPILGSPVMEYDRKHGSVHVTEFCDWVCFPNDLCDGFARKVTGVPFEEARQQVIAWASQIRAQWAGRVVPDGSDYDFWKHQWTATHGGSKPANGAQGFDPLAGLKAIRGGNRG